MGRSGVLCLHCLAVDHRLIKYLSTFRHSLDARNRVTVPSQWRVEGDEGNYYMAWPHPDGYISFFTPEMQQELHAKVRSIAQSDTEGQQMLRELFGSSCMVGCDKQGRIVLPVEMLVHAGIQKDAVLVGVGTNFQMWAAERYEPPKANILETMRKLGI